MHYHFFTCDVFTETRFGGNPLAVLPNASGLTTEQMQLIAREFNYSETTFVFPAEQGYTRKVRIFTPQWEVPFAGHPNIGTAFVLASSGELGDIDQETHITFEEQAGLVPITIRQSPKNGWWCELKAPEPLSLGKSLSAERMADVLSLAPDDIEIRTHVPQQASVGIPFVMAELKTLEALANVNANIDGMRRLVEDGIRSSVYVYVRSSGDFDIRGRMFAPLAGIPEDPATGSANCALVALLAHYDQQTHGEFRWRIAQGVEMKRPSVLNARTQKQNGTVTGVWIAGNSVSVSQGQIEID